MADLTLMCLRTADVAAKVCIRDERGAVVDPEQPVAFLSAPALVDVQVHWTCCGSYA